MLEENCPYCGTANPVTSTNCSKCGALMAQAPQQQAQPQSPQPVMQQTQLSSVKKSKTPIIAAAIIAIVVALILVLFVVLPAMTNPYPIHEGDYITYSCSSLSLSQPFYGTMKLTFTDITSATFTITTSYTGDLTLPSTSKTYPRGDVIGIGNLSALGTYQGSRNIKTDFGLKYLDHYQFVNSSGTFDYEIGHDNKIPYVMTYEESGGGLGFRIIETNIDWIKNTSI